MADVKTATKPAVKQYTGVTLKSPDGARLECYVRRVPGGARTGVDHVTAKNGDGKRIHTRGASSEHPSWEEAIAQQQKLIEQAVKSGWQRPTGLVRGPRPDAFDAAHLPAPAAPKPTTKK